MIKPINSVIDGSLSFFGFDSRETTIEDWNERRLRYVIKRYGSIKGDRLTVLATSPAPCDASRSSLRYRLASSSHTEPMKIISRRQLSNVTTFSLPVAPVTTSTHKPHAMKVILSAMWNPRLLRVRKRTQGIETSGTGFERFHSAPTGRSFLLDTTDSHFINDKWVALKDSKHEETPFLTESAIIPIGNESNDNNHNRMSCHALMENEKSPNDSVDTCNDDLIIPHSSPSSFDLPSTHSFFQNPTTFATNEENRSRPSATVSPINIGSSPTVIPSRSRRLTESLLTPTRWASGIIYPHKDNFTEDIFRNKTTDYIEYRPYFTYWISFIHLFIFIAGSIGYGFAPIGLGIATRIVGKVLLPTLTVSQVCWIEYENLWIGPRQTDLIRLGARFPPCMRFDLILHDAVIERQKKFDRASGCCIRNDGGGCYQTHRDMCSHTLATWLNYETVNVSKPRIAEMLSTSIADREIRTHTLIPSYLENNSYNNNSITSSIIHSLGPTRLIGQAGPVCGLDPDFCVQPRSSGAFAWSETDVTKWPICELPGSVPNMGGYAPHMECHVTGHPCCLGLKGECIMTTQEHCDFVRGFYYPNAALCSQVNCLNQICGMSPFINNEYPNQMYRIFTSLFLHAGLLHLILSLGVQMIFMRDLEKMIGWHRISLVYILSGCIGSLTSGIFLPYQVETGPTAAQFALLGVSLVDFIHCWQFLAHPWCALLRNISLIFILFTFGLLPWIDNYANAGSFLSGILLSFILLPFRGFINPSVSLTGSIATSVNQTIFDTNNYNTPTTPTVLFSFNFHDTNRKSCTSLQQHHHPHPQQLHQLQQQQHNYQCRHRCLIIILCSILWLTLSIGLIIMFIWGPIINCQYCNYFTCLPLTLNFCDNLQVNVKQRSDCILPNWI
ncbi:Inactive rhomboid protein 1 [Schistosoma japonicum]|nr:Inactive rhomboid protein 1 [Schistosoma japonicum]